MIRRTLGWACFLLCICLCLSCFPTYKKYIPAYEATKLETIPDYSQLPYWAAHPYKHSTADSVPIPLQALTIRDSSVDVFFLHPTTFISSSDTAWNADINDAEINAKTDFTTILYQASTFNECRVFAPRYRQANLRAYFTSDTARARQAFDLAYEDIRRAFQSYLTNYNQGRPIIIASHSQGSTHAKRLLKEFFEGKSLMSKLVVAYVVGMDIPKNYFSTLPPCKDSLQTGCVVGWRTFRNGFEPEYVKKEKGNSIVTNPITWQMNEDFASREQNKGSILRHFNSLDEEVADAQIHDDVLWIHKPRFPGGFFYRTKNYHIADINLFYMDIRMNVRRRIAMFWKN